MTEGIPHATEKLQPRDVEVRIARDSAGEADWPGLDETFTSEIIPSQSAEGDGPDPEEHKSERKGRESTDPVMQYLSEISRVPLLNAEQEVALSKRIEAGQAAEKLKKLLDPTTAEERTNLLQTLAYQDLTAKYIARKRRKQGTEEVKPPSEKELKAAKDGWAAWGDKMRQQYFADCTLEQTMNQLECLIQDGEQAKTQMINANLRLVVSIAKRHIGRGLQFLDLIQEGNTGLIHSVEKFDYARGNKFSTYATWWIRQAITRAITDQARTIRVPVHFIEMIDKVETAKRRLAFQQPGALHQNIGQIAAEAGIDPGKVQEVLDYLHSIGRPVVSLDMLVTDDRAVTLADIVSEAYRLSLPDEILRHQAALLLQKNIESLPDDLAVVIRLRFIEDKPVPHDTIAKMLGVSRETVRRDEHKALRLLKKQLKEHEDLLATLL